MKNGIYKEFKNVFSDYSEFFTIIGGTACTVLLIRENLNARATKDYDIVIHEKGRSESFFKVLTEFLNNGKYKMHVTKDTHNLYRFSTKENDYPPIIELLYKREDFIETWTGPIRRISFTEGFSLSAIMLDQEYHQFVVDNTEIVNEMPVLNKEGLLVLKARAWYNLFLEKSTNDAITSHEISKHLKDISRILLLFEKIETIKMNQSIMSDMQLFLILLKDNITEIPQSRDYVLTRKEVFEMLSTLLIDSKYDEGI